MKLIDSKQAFINPVSVSLSFTKPIKNEETDKISYQVDSSQISKDKTMILCWNNKKDVSGEKFAQTKLLGVKYSYIRIPDKKYAIGKSEVTQELYEAVMDENPSYFKGENLPVEKVSWYDAIYFCNKLSILFKLTPVYSVDDETIPEKWGYTPHCGNSIAGTISQNLEANGFRLPTNEEWEYAAKGGEEFKYAGSDNIDEVAWYESNSDGKTHTVATKKANGYGLYDMSGNVAEWVWDSYSSSYLYERGGSWSSYGSHCGVSYREYDGAYYRLNYLGFRVLAPLK
ncbi:MAG: formylglycine-generating enzyme family protein [Treponemataceae bacterium]|nr:formylglycine-generating enzyme family protein [Treponemataceae bacterium]